MTPSHDSDDADCGQASRDGGAAADDPAPSLRDRQRDVAAYIAAMCADLIVLADGARLHTLCYFLDMARADAGRLGGLGPPDPAKGPASQTASRRRG